MFSLPVSASTELRILEVRFAPQYYAIIQDNGADLRQWLTIVDRFPHLGDVERYLKFSMNEWSEGRGFLMGIWHDNVLVGSISLQDLNLINKSAALGYFVVPQVRGKGIATAVVRAVINAAFAHYDLQRIVVQVVPTNEASRRIPIGLGFRHEATLRECQQLNEVWHDREVYGLLREEWNG